MKYFLGFMAAILLAAPNNIAAQPPAPYLEQVDVRVVNVDVYVTDKEGNPVTDLTADEFSLLIDGRPVAISNFYAVEDSQPRLVTSASAAIETTVADQPVDGAPEPVQLPESQQLWTLIYVDNYNVEAIHRNRVLRELVSYLSRTRREQDRVMIVSYERSLNVRHSFWDDPGQAIDALLALQEVPSYGENKQSEWEEALAFIEDSRTFQDAMSWAESHADYMQNERSFTLKALNSFIEGLRGLPGRKALIYVSDGIPIRAADSLFQAIDARFRGGGHTGESPVGSRSAIVTGFEYDATRDLDRLAVKANTARVAFFPIDAAGQRAPVLMDPQFGGLQTAGLGTLVSSSRKANVQGSLAKLADKTGGKALLNRTRALPGLEEISRGLNNYYSLGFTPLDAVEGRFRNIEVRVARKGLRVRHREGYRALSLAERVADRTTAALVHGYGDTSDTIQLVAGAADDEQHGQWVQPIDVRIPLGELTFIPGDDGGESARVRVALAAVDERGRTSPVEQANMVIDVPAADVGQVSDKYYVASFGLLMRQGGHKVAATVHDEVAAKTWTGTTTVLVN